MSEEKEKKEDTKLVENGGNKTTRTFEELHNLVGVFSILLEVDKRKNPKKYLNLKKSKIYD